MNYPGSTVSLALSLALPFIPLTAKDQQDTNPARANRTHKVQSSCREVDLAGIDMPSVAIDLNRLALSLQELALSLRELESNQLADLSFQLSHLPAIEIPEIDLPHFSIHIPPVAVEIPPIPPIPPIEVPEFVFGNLATDCDAAAHKIFQFLSDEDYVKLQALRSLACQGPDQAIAAYEQVQKQKGNPAMRYEAVRQLGNFLDDGRVLTIIGDAAKTDRNLDVRKKAIALLGKSRDPRSTRILEEILMN